MVLKDLMPDPAGPFRVEMAALQEVERLRLARLTQAFCLLIFCVEVIAVFFLLIISINTRDFFSATLALACLIGAIIAGYCYKLSEKQQNIRAARLLLTSSALVVGYSYFLVGTAIVVPVEIVLNIVIAAILLQTLEVVFFTAFWMFICIFLFLFQNYLGLYRPPIPLDNTLQLILNLLLIILILPFTAVSLLVPARSHTRALRTRNQRLEKLLEQQFTAEARLQENEQRLKATFDQVSIGIAYIARGGQCLSTNRKLQEMFGYSQAELSKLNFHDLTYPDDRERGLTQFAELWEGRLPHFSQDKRYIRKDGSIIWCATNSSPVKDAEGQPRYFISVLNDITQRKQVEAALAAEKERLAVTLRSIGEGVITTDTEGRVTLLNPVAEKFTGWSQAEAVGRPLPEVFHIIDENTRQLAANPAEHVLRTGEVIGLASQTILVGRDGYERYVSNNGAPIRDLADNIKGVVLVFRDITERQRIEAELRKVQKLESLGLLAGGIAHDFNNILTAIAGNISLAKMDIPRRSSAFEVLDGAEKATFRAKDLTQQLLTFSQGGAPVKKTTSLKELLESSVSFALRGSNVQAKFDIPADLWPVEIDSGQVNQVLNNLVINADQAMPEGGLLTIKARNIPRAELDRALNLPGAAYVRVQIKDQGLGIPKKNLARIFDPYFTTKQKGSGLGLASCFSIIARHEGTILVESELGKGSTFCFYLPAAPGKTVQAESQAATIKSGKGKILLMDDDEMILALCNRLLDRLGYQVEVARDGAEAVETYRLALARRQPFDLVIMDLTVKGGMGGKEALLHLRELDPSVKAIVSSGYSTDPIMANYRAYHFKETLSKPFRVEELTEKIEKVLQGD